MGLPLMPMSSAQANSGNSCFAEGLANVALHKAVLPDFTAANLVRVDAAAITAGLVQKHCGLQYHAFIAGLLGTYPLSCGTTIGPEENNWMAKSKMQTS